MQATVESTPPLTKKKTLRSRRDCADLLFDRRGSGRRGSQSRRAAANVEDEVGQDLTAAAGCGRLRDGTARRKGGVAGAAMAATAQVSVLAENVEAGRRRGDQVAMAHPDLLGAVDAVEQNRVGSADVELGEAVFAVLAFLDLIRPAGAPSTAGRSRCRARAVPAARVAGSMVGLPAS